MSQLTVLIKRYGSTVFALGIILLPIVVYAAPVVDAKQGITVSPAIITINIDNNDTEKLATVGVKNNLAATVTLTAQLKGVDESNGILTPTRDLSNQLQSIMTIDNALLTLLPGQSADIHITIQNSSLLNPGGTYAALVIKQIAGSSGSVGLQSAIGAGIFITKQQGAERNLVVTNFSLNQFIFNEPRSAIITFKNSGNVHVVPRGIIAVTAQDKSKLFNKGIINQESFTIFPGKSITLEVPLNTVTRSYLPGKQQVIAQYRIEGTDDIKTITKTILYIPSYLYIFLIGVIIIAVVVIRHLKRPRLKKEVSIVAYDKAKTNNSKQKQIVIRDQTDGEKISVRKG